MPVITFSRQRGSLGSYIAVDVARRLGLRYLDREILEDVARGAGVTPDRVEAIEARAGRLARTLYALGARPKLPSVASASLREQASYESRVGALMTSERLSREAAVARLESLGAPTYAPPMDYLNLVTSVVLEYAAEGDAMIVGRGGQVILRRQPGVLHVQVVARWESRVSNIMEREGVKWRDAAQRLRLADEQRAGYLRRFYNVDWMDSSLYDLVINTDQIGPDAAADIVVTAAHAAEGAGAQPAAGGESSGS
jgi:hypothetical protein